MAFIRFLLILALVYYAWRIISRYILYPLLQGYFANSGNQQQHKHYRKNKEGETTINYVSQKKKFITKDRGEYIDYEEIEN